MRKRHEHFRLRASCHTQHVALLMYFSWFGFRPETTVTTRLKFRWTEPFAKIHPVKFCYLIFLLEFWESDSAWRRQGGMLIGPFHPHWNVKILLPPANEVWGKVIFLHLSVILFTGGSASVHAGIPPDQAPPWHPPPTRHPSPPPRCACWEIRSTGGRYASYWNAILFTLCYWSTQYVLLPPYPRQVLSLLRANVTICFKPVSTR